MSYRCILNTYTEEIYIFLYVMITCVCKFIFIAQFGIKFNENLIRIWFELINGLMDAFIEIKSF
jgi:hypothetical protein